MIGQKLSPILKEIEDSLWEFEAEVGQPPLYTNDGFRGGIKIFISVMLDKMWDLQEDENMSMEDRSNMAEKCGSEVMEIVRKYTGVNTHELY